MTWLILSLRKCELQRSISDHTYEELQLSRQLRKLASFSNAIGDGTITPNEISSLGTDLFGDALDFMGYSNDAAKEAAQEQTDYYATAYDSITQEQYYNNPGIASRAQLYFNENGELDTDAMFAEFYEEALKEYAQQCIAPMLKAKEEEIEDAKANLETQIQSEQAELQQLDNSISQAIQQETIKLS